MSMNEMELAEKPALQAFQDMGYDYKPGRELGPNSDDPERESLSDVVLRGRLERKLRDFNPSLPDEAIEDAISQLLGFNSTKLLKNNKDFHEKLVNGIQVEYEVNGETRGDFVDVFNFDEPEENDFLVSNQVVIQIGERPQRKPDVIVFVNGLPVGVLEMKDPTNPQASMGNAYKQVTDRYVNDIPDLFHYNEVIGIMDMNNAQLGCLSAGWEWFSPWRYIDEEKDTTDELPPSEVLIRGAFDKERLLDLIENFIVYSDSDGTLGKKLAAYHQFYAVNSAVESSKSVVPNPDEDRIGLVWHTQGSGKSLSMVFYAKKIKRESSMKNPTLVFLTDRNDLDDQLHTEFQKHGLNAEWADSDNRVELRERLDREAGGIIFATIQKFQTTDDEVRYPEVNDRDNVIVVADEAHRTQYKSLATNVRDGLPNASHIGFTATPIEKEDRSTTNTFGGYISQYTIRESEKDESTVPIYYESRLAKLQVNDPEIEDRFNELMESKSDDLKQEMKRKWTQLRRVIENSEERTEMIAEDIVEHFNNREIEGKGMVVAISRQAAVNLSRKIREIPGAPETRVVISGAEDFIDNPISNEELKRRFKDEDDLFKIAVVCDKWLTGFDAPHLHTLYIDKPMKNHNLLQAIGRVNRVYKDKPGGLIVDYIGISERLKKALDKYTSEVQNDAMLDIEEAVKVMKEKHREVADFFAHVDYDDWPELDRLERKRRLYKAQNEVLITEEREEEFRESMKELKKAHSLVTPNSAASDIRADVAFFEAVLGAINSIEESGNPDEIEDLDSAMKELVAEGVGIEDLVEVTGFDKWEKEKPVLSDEFLQDVEEVEFENLQMKMLRQLLENEISTRKKGNLAKYESFEEELEETIDSYNNGFLSTQQVIDELREYANRIQDTDDRQDELGLSDEELAFYDAISSNTDAEIDEEVLKSIAKELQQNLKDRVELDWTSREKIRAEIKTEVKAVLRSNGLSLYKYEDLVDPIVSQAEAFYGGAAA
ncbi:type I restriction endonuclease subunit R [Haloarcula marismortui]|uniref:type I site-specific deoxyribonuclease n=1 Tax=Haloarcula marismortui ATCC 33800 TaxID=662476 RepID=M0K322_9EURY|nr:type I restriction endonuclease subunit R [Haloarcula sinaiiensis]EMA15193.1 type I site-specific deoxyribonuclease subunit hsdR [Haloarcula sinaiiensis ATCC 33800]QUJ71949.1 type I restriction endonuclease subunit R [Haloarcula sinaiiensis ATCC 33800]